MAGASITVAGRTSLRDALADLNLALWHKYWIEGESVAEILEPVIGN